MNAPGGSPADPSLDRYARLVSRTLGSPVALVSLIEEGRQRFPGACGLPADVDAARETPLSHSFCQYVVADQAPVVVSDAREDERLRDNPAITDLGVVAYAGWPLTDHTGTIVGSLCAIDTEPRTWSAYDLEMLADLAAACSTELSERGLRVVEQDLAHRSRVLLALSDSLGASGTLADVAAAVEAIALDELGCLHAGMWLREHADPRPAEATTESITYVTRPDDTWTSARRNGQLPLDDSNPLGLTILQARSQHYADKADQNVLYPHLDTSAQIGNARSFTPLFGRGSVLGAMAFLWEDAHTLTEQDRRTIEVLTSYIGQAVQRVMLLQERLDALVTLQSALLPRLPTPEDLDIAARYRPAAARDQVGGDWYDAVIMASGATSIMVGDVVGHDLEAAAVMGQMRHMLRAIAWAVDDAPSRNVARLDEAMVDLSVEGMATLVYARVEPDDRFDGPGRVLRWTNAGHPPPLLVTSDGETAFLEDGLPDLMVGVLPATERTDHSAVVPPGSTLLLYTDGLVERRGENITVGLQRLADAARRHHALGVDAFLDGVLGDLVGDELFDDVAVLAVHLPDEHLRD